MSEPIEMPFGFRTRMGPKNYVLDGVQGRCHGNHFCLSIYGCTLAPPGEYDWTVRVRRRCGLMSNYFDQLLIFEDSFAANVGQIYNRKEQICLWRNTEWDEALTATLRAGCESDSSLHYNITYNCAAAPAASANSFHMPRDGKQYIMTVPPKTAVPRGTGTKHFDGSGRVHIYNTTQPYIVPMFKNLQN